MRGRYGSMTREAKQARYTEKKELEDALKASVRTRLLTGELDPLELALAGIAKMTLTELLEATGELGARSAERMGAAAEFGVADVRVNLELAILKAQEEICILRERLEELEEREHSGTLYECGYYQRKGGV